jgi:hypothetical protein
MDVVIGTIGGSIGGSIGAPMNSAIHGVPTHIPFLKKKKDPEEKS